jgi:hypothetical protein
MRPDVGDEAYARAMSLPSAYLTSFKNTSAILKAIQTAQAPPRFTQKFLEGLGFPNANDGSAARIGRRKKSSCFMPLASHWRGSVAGWRFPLDPSPPLSKQQGMQLRPRPGWR